MLLCPGLTEGNSLPNTDNASAPDELADIVSRGESLNESGDDNENTAGTHAKLSAGEVGDRTTEKEAPENGTNGVGGIDGANDFAAGVSEPLDPVLRALDRIIHAGVITV